MEGRGGLGEGWGKGGSVYKQPETGEDGPDTAGGCQVSRRGHNRGRKGELPKGSYQRGAKQGEMRHVYM